MCLIGAVSRRSRRGIQHDGLGTQIYFGTRRYARRQHCAADVEKWVAFVFYHQIQKVPSRRLLYMRRRIYIATPGEPPSNVFLAVSSMSSNPLRDSRLVGCSELAPAILKLLRPCLGFLTIGLGKDVFDSLLDCDIISTGPSKWSQSTYRCGWHPPACLGSQC